jgi:hypothetical protein
MPMWRCPHCGTPQAETARCWVCRRSSTACATCRNFRRSVAAQLGYCGLDRERAPLRGDEIRACWEAAGATTEGAGPSVERRTPAAIDAGVVRTPVRRLEFVEVGAAPVKTRRRGGSRRRGATGIMTEVEAETATDAPVPLVPGEPRWSLWGDSET